jgi:hypothetical protein
MNLPKISNITFAEHKLADREHIFAATYLEHQVELPEPQYAIAWEDPDDLEAPMKFTTPSPMWLAMALHGDILPPVEVYHALAHDEAQPNFKRHHRGYLLHETTPVNEMTEEEAMDYLIQKDIPPSVWRDYRGNRTILKVVSRNAIPTDRTTRNAWRITQNSEGENI